jgi:hypothetical protein
MEIDQRAMVAADAIRKVTQIENVSLIGENRRLYRAMIEGVPV